PTWGTPDYFNRCSRHKADVPKNFAGKEEAVDGDGYAGFIPVGLQYFFRAKASNIGHSREYISTKLTQKLTKDSLYCISFFISQGDYSYIRIDELGLYFSYWRIRSPFNQKELNKEPQILFNGLISCPRNGWLQLKRVFKATGHERYMTIGVFQTDKEVNWVDKGDALKRESFVKDKSDMSEAYYYIDKVELRPLSDPECPCRQGSGANTLSPE
ncbi:MAG: hypothetical protein R6U85_12660, partial [Salinivirgaceae bacterium]